MTAPDWRQNGYGIMGEFRRDPVCGMPVDTATARVTDLESGEVFCSEYCRETFLWRQASAPRWTKEMSEASRRIAYFSMEMALDERLPTYSGGLGILAGDMLRSCADLGVPIVGVTLVHRCGYFCQVLSGSGEQQEMPEEWSPKARLVEMPRQVQVRLDGVPVSIRAWRLDVRGTTGKVVPVLMLDTDLQLTGPPRVVRRPQQPRPIEVLNMEEGDRHAIGLSNPCAGGVRLFPEFCRGLPVGLRQSLLLLCSAGTLGLARQRRGPANRVRLNSLSRGWRAGILAQPLALL